jgi:hypothetical protein
MKPTALIIEIFGLGSLTIAFAKYTLVRRKAMQAVGNMKNHDLICNRYNRRF